MQLGKKIRDMRCRRGLTVQQLAVASGLSKGFISQVEHDRTSPSLASLKDLARALDTSVAYLVDEDEQAPYVVREGHRPKIHVAGNASRVEILSAQPRRNLELLMTEIPPGVTAGNGPPFHHGEKCFVCLEGNVTIACGEHRLVLEAGDSCHSDGRAPQAIENTGSSTARVLIAITPAAFEPLLDGRRPAVATNGGHVKVQSLA